jgi:hypothetical protein
MWLDADFSPRGHEFNTGWLPVRFAVCKIALEECFSQFFCFPPLITILPLLHTHLSLPWRCATALTKQHIIITSVISQKLRLWVGWSRNKGSYILYLENTLYCTRNVNISLAVLGFETLLDKHSYQWMYVSLHISMFLLSDMHKHCLHFWKASCKMELAKPLQHPIYWIFSASMHPTIQWH